MRYQKNLFFSLGLIILQWFPGRLQAQLRVDTTVSIGALVNRYFLTGTVKAFHIRYQGSKKAIGLFNFDSGSFEIKKGILISTGYANEAIGPNNQRNVGGPLFFNQFKPDRDLAKIARSSINDQAILEFDFIPVSDSISFKFIFGSEEYPEYVGSAFNDVFAFFLSGPGIAGVKNLAVLPGTDIPITINTINHKKNKQYYRDNSYYLNPKTWALKRKYKKEKYRSMIDNSIQFDGYTTLLFAKSNVIPNQVYHIKIVIADVEDNIYDSGVFLQANSFISYARNNDTLTNKAVVSKKIKQNKGNDSAKTQKKDSIIATFTMHINFDFDSVKIPDSSFYDLNKICSILKEKPGTTVEIYGHTDSIGTAEYNLSLSARRAGSVAGYLENCGISKSRMHSYGKGWSEPVAPNNTSRGRALNRRVVFVIKS
jgi:outer membrane protein OmpA-like peptidoglycan-associated protein